MRFYKREIGKKVIIKWDDTISHLKVILKSEKWAGDDSGDYTLIPRGMITEVRVLDD